MDKKIGKKDVKRIWGIILFCGIFIIGFGCLKAQQVYAADSTVHTYFFKSNGKIEDTPSGAVLAWFKTSESEKNDIETNKKISYDKKTDTLTIGDIDIDEMDVYASNLFLKENSTIDVIKTYTDVTLDVNGGNSLTYTKVSGQMELANAVKDKSSSYVKLKDLSTATLTLEKSSYTYTGAEIKPAVTVKSGETTLVEDSDYKVTYKDNLNSGKASVVVEGIGNYCNSLTATFTIEQCPVSSCTISDLKTMSYTGKQLTQAITIKNGDVSLTQDTDCKLTWGANVNAGTGTVTISGAGNYSGTVTKSFTISPISLKTCTITGATTAKTYTGAAITQSPVVTSGAVTLINGTDYTVTYSNNINAGTATISFTGSGKNCTDSNSVTFTIAKANISSATATISALTYTGSAQTPVLATATYGSKSLVKGTDYTIVYSDNVNAGTGKATLTGINNFTGTKVVGFTIAQKTQTIESEKTSYKYAYSKNKTYDLGVHNAEGGGTLSYKSASTGIVTVSSTGVITIKGYGQTTITITAAEKGNYKATSKTVKISVVPAKITIASVTSSSAGALSIKWTKPDDDEIEGYIISYGTDEDATNKGTIKISDESASSKTISGLAKGTTYYVKICAYVDADYLGYYSSISSIKTQ